MQWWDLLFKPYSDAKWTFITFETKSLIRQVTYLKRWFMRNHMVPCCIIVRARRLLISHIMLITYFGVNFCTLGLLNRRLFVVKRRQWNRYRRKLTRWFIGLGKMPECFFLLPLENQILKEPEDMHRRMRELYRFKGIRLKLSGQYKNIHQSAVCACVSGLISYKAINFY